MCMVDTRVMDGFTLKENGEVLRRLHRAVGAVIPPPYQGGG